MTEGMVTINGIKFPTIKALGLKEIATNDNNLYNEYVAKEYSEKEITLIPYYAWANRGENEMSVWVRV